MFLQRDEPLTHPAVIFFHIFAGIITEPDMKFVHILLSATILASSSPALRAGESDDLIMKNEAAAFLSNMPENLQHIQSEAIIKAIGGNLSDLEAVRNSRNTPPPLPENVEVRQMTDRLRIYEPKTAGRKPLPALIYLHGGGWTFGSLNSCARFCGAVASGGNIKVIAVDYRLAPENPFPAGLNDCIESMKFVSSRCDSLGIDPDHIAIGGDSSGGNLAIATALAPECKGLLNALILFYPVTKAYTDALTRGTASAKDMDSTPKSWKPSTVPISPEKVRGIPLSVWPFAATATWSGCRRHCLSPPDTTYCGIRG